MRKMLATSVLALFGLAPALGSACEYEKAATSASATPPAQLASVQTPAASKAPAPSVLKASAPKTPAKQVSDKTKESSRTCEGRGSVRQLDNAPFKKARPVRAFLWAIPRNTGAFGTEGVPGHTALAG